MELSQIQKDILRLFAYRNWSNDNPILDSQELAERINKSRNFVNDELDKLEAMQLLKVTRAAGGSYSAFITPEGKIVVDEIGPTLDK